MTDERSADAVAREAETPGAQWRVLARDGSRTFEACNEGIFDELVVGHWLHLEQMDERHWWMRVGDATLNLCIDEDGGVQLSVERGVHANPTIDSDDAGRREFERG